jgi:hypothetical protein
MRQDSSFFVYGTQGNNIAANTTVASLAVPSGGRYRVWGMARHTLADGLKFTTPIAMIICSGPNDTAMFGPFVVDMAAAGNIVIQLNTATGAADTAAANIYAEKINH